VTERVPDVDRDTEGRWEADTVAVTTLVDDGDSDEERSCVSVRVCATDADGVIDFVPVVVFDCDTKLDEVNVVDLVWDALCVKELVVLLLTDRSHEMERDRVTVLDTDAVLMTLMLTVMEFDNDAMSVVVRDVVRDNDAECVWVPEHDVVRTVVPLRVPVSDGSAVRDVESVCS